MDSSLRFFIEQYIGVVLVTLFPVLLIAFMTIPVSLSGHTDALTATPVAISRHMT